MSKHLIALVITAFFAATTFAQADANYRIQQYTTENGMPSNGVKGLKWDEKTGFLWIATEAGVARFNGLDFTIFNKDNTTGLAHERMAYLVKNAAGNIYTSDVNGNIFIIDGSAIKLKDLPGLSNLVEFRTRYCLSVTNNELQKKILSLINKTPTTPWIKLLQPDDGSVIVIDAANNFLYTSSKLADFTRLQVPPDLVNGMMIDGACFFLDRKGLIYSATDNFKNFIEKKIISENGAAIKIDPKNSFVYWENGMKNPILFSGTNAWLLTDKKTYVEADLICSAIPSYSFIQSAQYSEKNKTLFIGTDSKGIIIINANRVQPIKQKETDIRERNTYYSQVELSNGNILTNEGHVVGSSTVAADIPIKGKFNFTVSTSGDSLVWFAQTERQVGYSCLHKYDNRTRQTSIYPKIPVAATFAFLETGDGKRFIVTSEGLGLLKDDSLQFAFRNIPDKGNNTAPYSIQELSDGILAVASCNGLIRYNLHTMVADTILTLPGYCVRTTWKYNDYLFIGTYGKGYYIYKNGILKAMPLDKNRFLLHTHCFVPDPFGFIWISTNRGLFKAQLSDIVNAFEKNTPEIYYHYFGKNDGMEMTEMNGGCAPCALLMKNKNISFPTMDGLLWVDPVKANPLLPDGDIYIDEFRAGNRKLDIAELAKQELPSKARDILIKISFSAWCNKENIYLDYKLNNSNEWIPIEVANTPEIKLSNLSPGSYKLTIRKINGFGANNYSYKEIDFSIKVPWYQQWWFYVLALLSIIGMISLFFYFRTKQFTIRQRKLEQQVAQKTKELQDQNEVLEKNNTIKTRLISIISHDIVTPLKFLTSVGKNLGDNINKMPEELQKETIYEMANTSQELHLLSTNILNWIKYQNENRRLVKEPVHVNVLVSQVMGILVSIARSKGLEIRNEVDESLIVNQYAEALKILLYNLVTNAINFSDHGVITIRSKKANNNVVLTVMDEGVGMTSEQVKNIMSDEFIVSSANVDNRKGNGLGYLIIKDLLKMMGAVLHIESEKKAGSTISIIIPV